MADRYTYITLIGLFVVIAWGANDLLFKLSYRKIWLGTLSAILLPILMGLTWKQVQYWKNDIKLFEHTLSCTTNNYVAHNSVGIALTEQGCTEAIEHYLEALHTSPDNALARNNLGNTLRKQGRTEEAIEHYLKALRTNPDNALTHNNLAILLFRNGDTNGAIVHLRKALSIDPDNINLKNNLSKVLNKIDP